MLGISNTKRVSLFRHLVLLLCLCCGCGGGGGSFYSRDTVPTGGTTYARYNTDLQALARGWSPDLLTTYNGLKVTKDSFMFTLKNTTIDQLKTTRYASAITSNQSALLDIVIAQTGYSKGQITVVDSPNPLLQFYHVSLAAGADLGTEMQKFKNVNVVDQVVPNAVLSQPEESYEKLPGTSTLSDWASQKINLPSYSSTSSSISRKVTVAVIDTGFDPAHPAMKNSVVSTMSASEYSDIGWHGTFVSGIILAAGNGQAGANPMRGVAEGRVSLAPIVACNEQGQCPYADVISALARSLDESASVIMLNLCAPTSVTLFNDTLTYVTGRTLVVSGACNQNSDASSYLPAANTSVVTVGATNSSDQRASATDWGGALGSNFGSVLDLSAPGTQIISTLNSEISTGTGFVSGYAVSNGTSYSAAYVTGLVAMIMSLEQNYNATSAISIIRSTTRAITTDKYLGSGMIDAGAAYNLAD